LTPARRSVKLIYENDTKLIQRPSAMLRLRVFLLLPVLLAALSASAAPQRTVLSVAAFPDLDRSVRIAIESWSRTHPEVEVKLTSRAIADHHTAMVTAIATGSNLPDVMAIDMDQLGRFTQQGGLEDLDAAPYDAGRVAPQLAHFALGPATGLGGRLRALPADVGPGALFYRTDLLARAGLTEADLTRSWEAYIEAGRKLKAATGVYLLANAVDLKDIVVRSGLSDGEGVYFDASGRPQVESPRFVQAFTLARAARRAGIDARVTAWASEWSEGLRSGRIASQMMGSWLAGHLKNWIAPSTTGLWRSAPLPGGAHASWGGSFFAIPVKAEHKALAWDFIRTLCLDRAQQLEAFRRLDAFPALIAAQQDDYLAQPIPFLGGQTARLQWREAAARIPALYVDRYDQVAADIVNAELDQVLQHDKPIAQALADARVAIERRVRRRH
jgi:multiple sugar transport system substrate-binding protein